jgi:hypothetical protein
MYRNPARLALCAIAVILLLASAAAAQDKNLTVAEIFQRHLRSFGANTDIGQSTNRLAVGTSDFRIISASTHGTGGAQFASDGKNMALLATFDLRDYRMDRIGLFSDKVTIPFIYQGHRSALGTFLTNFDETLSGKIFGGAIFSTWLGYSTDPELKRFSVDGKKKVDGRDAWVVKYSPPKGLGNGSYIKLYFDAENFRHIRTEFRQKEHDAGFQAALDPGSHRGSEAGDLDTSMASNASMLVEDFGDFSSDASGIILPHSYSVSLEMDTYKGTFKYGWKFQIKEYKLIRQFPASYWAFTAETPG